MLKKINEVSFFTFCLTFLLVVSMFYPNIVFSQEVNRSFSANLTSLRFSNYYCINL